jgi:hypothetical protein
MSTKEPRDDLALRKELLLAQSTLYRAKLRHELTTLRSNALSKGSLFGLLTLAGASRASGWIALAGRALLFARLAKTVIGLFRK